VAIVEALGEVTLLYIEGLVANEPIIVKLPGILDVKRVRRCISRPTRRSCICSMPTAKPTARKLWLYFGLYCKSGPCALCQNLSLSVKFDC
jgi:hypothetical protein